MRVHTALAIRRDVITQPRIRINRIDSHAIPIRIPPRDTLIALDLGFDPASLGLLLKQVRAPVLA